MRFTSITIDALWQEANHSFLKFLIAGGALTGPILARCWPGPGPARLFFATSRGEAAISGCALIDGRVLSRPPLAIVHGDARVFHAFIQTVVPKDYTWIHVDRSNKEVLETGTSIVTREHCIVMQKEVPVKARAPRHDEVSFKLLPFSSMPAAAASMYGLVDADSTMESIARMNGVLLHVDDHPVGAVYDACSLLPRDLPVAWLGGVRIDAFKGKGLCKAMLISFMFMLVQQGKITFGLAVDPENDAACRCYRACGFFETARHFTTGA